MSRRVGLPGASELFRATSPEPQPAAVAEVADDAAPTVTGRIKHEEKITVYVSSDELIALEQSRLTLRARHGVAVDRGRIVRAAIATAMADLEEHGADAEFIKRLTGA